MRETPGVTTSGQTHVKPQPALDEALNGLQEGSEAGSAPIPRASNPSKAKRYDTLRADVDALRPEAMVLLEWFDNVRMMACNETVRLKTLLKRISEL